MSAGKKALVLLCAAACFALAVCGQKGAGKARARDLGEQLLYLPNEKLLNHFTAGLTSIVADLLWIECVQYTGKHVRTDNDLTWMKKMIWTVVRLDPYFTGVYLDGAIFLSSLQSDQQAAIELLERGFIMNPRAWELPHQIAMIHLVSRRGDYGADRLALHYLTMSAATGNAPNHVADLASKLQSDYDLFEIEEEMWTRILEEGGRLKRDLAIRKLRELELRKACHAFNNAVQTYRERKGRAPATLDDLLTSQLIGGVPEDPLGGRFFIAPDGAVHNTSLLDAEKERLIGRMRIALGEYEKTNGAWPPNLEALAETKNIFEIPAHPYPGGAWRYDVESGTIE